jgi:uncharacterized membrane protein YeaQ/YmgE (transglycosylase-associated protein family)
MSADFGFDPLRTSVDLDQSQRACRTASLQPGDNEPSGFIMTTILGIVGSFVASYLGHALGWYKAGAGAGIVGSIVGAIIVLLIYGFLAGKRPTSLRRTACEASMRRI